MKENKEVLTPVQELMQFIQIDQDPTQKGTFGIEQTKKALEWFAESYAEVLVTVKNKDLGKGIGGAFKFIKRFGDNLIEVKPILQRLDIAFNEIADIDNSEADELEAHFNWAIRSNLKKVGLDVEDESPIAAMLAFKALIAFA